MCPCRQRFCCEGHVTTEIAEVLRRNTRVDSTTYLTTTVHELFSVARDANIIPDISLDPVLTTYLSLDSSAALQHQYAFLQRSMSREQQSRFNLNLTQQLGGSSRVSYGGVGVVALALSLLFDQVAQQQVRAQGSMAGNSSSQRFEAKAIFGISSSSRIGRIIHSYLRLVPGVAGNEEKIAETTELYDGWLKLELIDHYERMTTKKRMSTVSMQQWLTGAAVHLHMRIHQVRLHSVPVGSARSLGLSYRTSLRHLLQGFTAYLRKHIQETAAPSPRGLHTRADTQSGHTNTPSTTNETCLSEPLSNISQANRFTGTTALRSTADTSSKCKTRGNMEEFRILEERNGTHAITGNTKTLTNLTFSSRKEEAGVRGLLVIEPGRNVSHSVQHHPCQSPAIQQALLTRIMNAQDLGHDRDIFQLPEKVFQNLLKQRNNFKLRII